MGNFSVDDICTFRIAAGWQQVTVLVVAYHIHIKGDTEKGACMTCHKLWFMFVGSVAPVWCMLIQQLIT